MQNLLKIKQVASLLGVSRECLWLWLKQKKFPQGIRIGRSLRWRPETVEEFLKSKEAEVRS